MKTRTKGIIFFAFVGGIMLASGVTIAIPASFFENSDTTLDSLDGTDPSILLLWTILVMNDYNFAA